jgi:transposase
MILLQYKEQSSVESSFKLMKNGAFELDSFLLKTPARITALMMVRFAYLSTTLLCSTTFVVNSLDKIFIKFNKLKIVEMIENPRVGGSIPSLATM